MQAACVRGLIGNSHDDVREGALRRGGPVEQEEAEPVLVDGAGLMRESLELGKGGRKEFRLPQQPLGAPIGLRARCEPLGRQTAEVVQRLLAASKLGIKNYHVSGTAAFYRAMSLFRQGKAAEAHKVATEAVANVKPLPADEKNPLVRNANADDVILWLAYKEAKELIRFEATPPPR